MITGRFHFLPIVAQRHFKLPRLFAPFDSIAKGNLRMGQVIGGSVVIGGDQLPPREQSAGKPRESEVWINGQLELTLRL